MVIQKNCDFINETSEPMISKVFTNPTGDILTLQVSGANGLYFLEGRNNTKGDWVPLAGINLSNFSVITDGFSAAGIYYIDVSGIREVRVRVESVEGTVSIFGQIISSEET